MAGRFRPESSIDFFITSDIEGLRLVRALERRYGVRVETPFEDSNLGDLKTVVSSARKIPGMLKFIIYHPGFSQLEGAYLPKTPKLRFGLPRS